MMNQGIKNWGVLFKVITITEREQKSKTFKHWETDGVGCSVTEWHILFYIDGQLVIFKVIKPRNSSRRVFHIIWN